MTSSPRRQGSRCPAARTQSQQVMVFVATRTSRSSSFTMIWAFQMLSADLVPHTLSAPEAPEGLEPHETPRVAEEEAGHALNPRTASNRPQTTGKDVVQLESYRHFESGRVRHRACRARVVSVVQVAAYD